LITTTEYAKNVSSIIQQEIIFLVQYTSCSSTNNSWQATLCSKGVIIEDDRGEKDNIGNDRKG
jgi:hypothetical protein